MYGAGMGIIDGYVGACHCAAHEVVARRSDIFVDFEVVLMVAIHDFDKVVLRQVDRIGGRCAARSHEGTAIREHHSNQDRSKESFVHGDPLFSQARPISVLIASEMAG